MIRRLILILALSVSGCVTADISNSPIVRPTEPTLLTDKPVRQPAIVRPAEGDGPFPAVVLMHTCGGIASHVNLWAQRLIAAGYVAYIVDSNDVRGVPNNCWAGSPINADDIALDAAAALAHLRTLRFVRPDRLGIMTFSFGGSALRLASAAYQNRFPGGVPGLRAIVAFYNACGTVSTVPFVQEKTRNLASDVVVPAMMFLGALDEETPPRFCTSLADRLKARGQPITYKLYHDTTHAFDQSNWGTQGRIMDMGVRGKFLYRYNPAATEDAWREAKALFKRELKGMK